jgi:transposase
LAIWDSGFQRSCDSVAGHQRGGRGGEAAGGIGVSEYRQKDLSTRYAATLEGLGLLGQLAGTALADLEQALWTADDAIVPALARQAVQILLAELHSLEQRIKAIELVIVREHKANAVSRRLSPIPGIGPITASALSVTIADPAVFKSGREFAAWHSSGRKQKLGRISKQGDRYLRRLLTVGATAVIRHLSGKLAF